MSPPTRPTADTTSRAAVLNAVVVAMAAIRPDTYEQARHLHRGYLAAHGVDESDIDLHWRQIEGTYVD